MEMIKMTMRKLFVFIVSVLLLNTNPHADEVSKISAGNTGGVDTKLNPIPIPMSTGTDFQISGGLQNGSNLFHTFGDFSIGSNDHATFTSAPNPSITVQNILARVTGNNESRIYGTISSKIDKADLYLINPHGIVFGGNAQLNVPGSFHATTADYMRLGKDGRFYASLSRESTFSNAPPEAFGFLDKHPISSISVKDNFLKVPVGKQLSLISGGKVEIDNGIAYAPGGRINVAAVTSAGEVEHTSSTDLQVTPNAQKGEVTISNASEPIDQEGIIGKKEGKNSVCCANLDVTPYVNEADEADPVATAKTAKEVAAGQIFIRSGKFVADNSLLFADRYNYKGEPKSSIDISVDDMEVINGARITADTYGSSNGGSIAIFAKNTFRLSGKETEDMMKFSTIATNTFETGKGGEIRINSPILEMSPGLIQASTDNNGEGGSIQIDAQQIKLSRGGIISVSASVSEKASGKAGNITLNVTDTVSLIGKGQIDARSNAGGGNITIQKLSNRLYLADSFISATAFAYGDQSEGNATGDAGNLDISDPKFLILNNSQLFARGIYGSGGNIKGNPYYLIRSFPYSNGGVYEGITDANGKVSRIDVSSKFGPRGEIKMKTVAKEEFINLLKLSQDFLKLELPLSRCALSKDSRFIITARDILPRCPEDLRTQTIRLWK